jgi:glycosyltransferase involved in cell wall biosynthesis
MKILIVNTSPNGGAANSCLRLFNGLLKEGVEVKILFREGGNDIPHSFRIKSITFLKKLIGKLKTDNGIEQKVFIDHRPDGLEFFSFPDSQSDITKMEVYKDADIIHLHWVANFLDWKSFFRKNNKPVVWTLHDQNPFLGGEHYEERYLGIDEKGYPKKRVVTEQEVQVHESIIKFKKKVLSSTKDLTVVSPSKWLDNSSRKSEVFQRFQHSLIPYGYPIDLFKRLDKEHCRTRLKIGIDKKVILFVADSTTNARKGFNYLLSVFETLLEQDRDDLLLCSVGSKMGMNTNHVLELGRVDDEELMANIYNAADVFVIPSLEDNLPNTMIESLLCGTPVIGFPTGGIVDAVIDKENGLICEEISVPALSETINDFLNGKFFFDSESISEKAKEVYDEQVQANSYINLYTKILSK